jgi:hypothetical protein
MKILKPTGNQTIKIIPRIFLEYRFDLRVRDRDLNKEYYYSYNQFSSGTDVISSVSVLGNELVITLTDNAIQNTFKMVEGRYYDFEYIQEYGTFYEKKLRPVYRETIFCTAQEINQKENDIYKPNLGSYKEHNTGGNENKFIIID